MVDLNNGAAVFYCSRDSCAQAASEHAVPFNIPERPRFCIHCWNCGQLVFLPKECRIHSVHQSGAREEGCPVFNWWHTGMPSSVVDRLITAGIPVPLPGVAMMLLDGIHRKLPEIMWDADELARRLMYSQKMWHRLDPS